MVWDTFERLFYENYFPQSIRGQKVREFMELKQGDMSVHQYAIRFEELSRFTPFLVVDETIKALKFKRGLRSSIHSYIVPFGDTTYAAILWRAHLVESVWVENHAQDQRKKARYDPNQKGEQPVQTFRRPPLPRANRRGAHVCKRCGRSRTSPQCRQETRTCFSCGRQGHIASQCYHRPRQNGQQQRPRHQFHPSLPESQRQSDNTETGREVRAKSML